MAFCNAWKIELLEIWMVFIKITQHIWKLLATNINVACDSLQLYTAEKEQVE